ncbi:MurR/RpiR family transcriptional regulator [Roseococcus sp.]|uniref:MurR/RpiR family transcriptional regulator n=1 Tax=Roseococcus sp. TaxID=2109646 RepID=UPI003BA9095A
MADRTPKELLAGLSSEAVDELPPAARLFAGFVLANRLTILTSSAAELASRVGVSDATIIRSVQALGFTGLPHLKQILAATMGAETEGPASDLGQTLAEAGEGARNALDLALDLQREAMACLDEPPLRLAMLEAVGLMHRASRIAVYGIGPTAHLARYMTSILQRSGRQAFAIDTAGISLADQLLALREGGHGPGDDLWPHLSRDHRDHPGGPSPGPARRHDHGFHRGQGHRDGPGGDCGAARGRAGHAAMHATTLAALEALSLGLAACDGSAALGSLVRLNQLRRSVMGPDVA